MELLGIKFNSLCMPLLNDDEMTFTLDSMCTYLVMTAIFLFLALEQILLFCGHVYFAAFSYFVYDYKINILWPYNQVHTCRLYGISSTRAC